MSNSDKHIEQRKQELLQKFLNQELSKDEQFELEKMALDDDFLFDALEGFHSVEHTHAESMESVDKKIEQRIKKNPTRKLRVIYWQISSIAAVLLILIAITFVVKNHSLNGSEELFPIAESKKAEEVDLIMLSDTSDYDPVIASLRKAKSISEKRLEVLDTYEQIESLEAEPSLTESSAKNNVTSEQEESTVDKFALEEDADQATENDQIALNDAAVKDSYETVKRAAVQKSKAPQAKIDADAVDDEFIDLTIASEEIRVGNAFIEGKVMRDNGEPIIGAAVQVPETSQETITDVDGNFNIDVPKEAQELEISYTGFNNVKVPIDGVSNLAVTLKEGAMRSEVVVVNSYKSFNSAVPVGGVEEFNLFVSENLIKPKEAIEAGISGTVIIEFSIGPYGKLSNFRVIESLGYGCDEEAIRILKNGVQWETFPKYKSMKTQYQFYF